MAINNTNQAVGYGGQTTWDVIKDKVLATPDATALGAPPVGQDRINALVSQYDNVIGGLQTTINKLEEANKGMLAGEIPADVQKQVMSLSSSTAGFRGLFGPAARSLTARDLGTTSLAIKQQGIQNQGAIGSLQDSLSKTTESVRQFNTEYNLRSAQFTQSVRDSNLRGLALEQERLEFNAKQNLAVTGLIADMVNQQQSIGYNYAAINASPGGTIETYQNWINQLTSLLT